MKRLGFFTASGLLCLMLITQAFAADRDTVVTEIISTIQSLGPAKSYDDSSATKLYNIYDTLIAFKGTKTEKFEPGKEMILERFDGYWGKKPAFKTVRIKIIPEWSTRKMMFLTAMPMIWKSMPGISPKWKKSKASTFINIPSWVWYAPCLHRISK